MWHSTTRQKEQCNLRDQIYDHNRSGGVACTFGEVSTTGRVAVSSFLDHISPFSRLRNAHSEDYDNEFVGGCTRQNHTSKRQEMSGPSATTKSETASVKSKTVVVEMPRF